MSLRRAKTIYWVMILSVATVLACTAGLIGWITAVLLLTGALPMFRAIGQASWFSGLIKSEHTLDLILAEFNENDAHQATQGPYQEPLDRPEHRRANAR
jgi:hypothetical protein